MRIVKYAKKNNVGIKAIHSYLSALGYKIDHKPTEMLTEPMLDDLSRVSDWEPLKALQKNGLDHQSQKTPEGRKDRPQIKKKKKLVSNKAKKSKKPKRTHKHKVAKTPKWQKETFHAGTIKFSDGELKIKTKGENSKEYTVTDDKINKVFQEYTPAFKNQLPDLHSFEMLVEDGEIKKYDLNQGILNWYFNHHFNLTGEDLLSSKKPNKSSKQQKKKGNTALSERNSSNKSERGEKKADEQSETPPIDAQQTITSRIQSNDEAKVEVQKKSIEEQPAHEPNDNLPIINNPLAAQENVPFRNEEGLELNKSIILESCKQISKECHNERDWPSKSSALLKFINEDQLKTFWIFSAIPKAYSQGEDLGGNPVLLGGGKYKPTLGSIISKNAPKVTEMLSTVDKEDTFEMRNGINVRVSELVLYKYHEKNPREFTIKIPGSPNSISFPHLNSLKTFLEKKDLQWIPTGSLEAFQNENDQNLDQIEPQFRDLKVIIRENLELRHENILNSDQNDIKRSHIYDDKTMVIDGGPGTGKTSTLIQRIKLLIENVEYIREYNENLSRDQLNRISNSKNQWLFIAPTQLLAHYLKSNLRAEGLSDSPEHLKDWPSYFKQLTIDYGLIKKDDQFPTESNLFFDQVKLSHLQKDFDKKYTQHLMDHFMAPIKGKGFRPKETKELIDNINSQRGKTTDLKRLSTLELRYKRVQQNFSDTIKSLRKRRDTLRSNMISTCVEGVIDQLETDDIIYLNSFVDSLSNSPTNEDAVNDSIHKIISKRAENIFKNSTSKLSPIETEIERIFLVNKKLSSEQLSELGEYIVFTKRTYNRFTKPFYNYYFSKIVSFYKQNYRKQTDVLDSFSLFSSEGQKLPELRIDEFAFLISFINEKVIMYEPTAVKKYFQPYEEHKRVVIAVDEATDLSLFEISCIYSLRDRLVHSVNFCGDLFQRMTEKGINDWNHLFSLKEDFKHFKLRTSYRQSSSLIDLARAIYRKFNDGIDPEYQSYMARFPKEPDPQLYIHSSEDKRLQWVFEFIDTIYRAYDNNLPSTAIFVTHENQAKSLQSYYKSNVSTTNYTVKKYSSIDKVEQNTVYIFELQDIKGLEFEAAIFYDLDNLLQENINPNRLLHYLYVGLTRAAFYFGVCSKDHFNGPLAFLNEALQPVSD